MNFEDLVSYQESKIKITVRRYVDGDTQFISGANENCFPRLAKCEYCGRGAYLSRDSLTCAGCGAPLPVEHARVALMYDPRILDAQQLAYIGRPNQNIPVNPAYVGRLSDDLIQGAATGASLLGGFWR